MDEEEFDQEQSNQEVANEENLADQGPEEDEMAEMEEAERQAEERLIANKLKQLLIKVKTKNILTITNLDDRKTIKKAKDIGKFKTQLLAIDVARAMNAQKTVSTTISASPALYYVGIIALCVVIIIVAVAIVIATFSFLFNWGDGKNATGSSVAGVKGTDFYGVRVAYQNESHAATQIIEDYVNLVVSGVENLQQTKSVNVGGSQYALQLNLNLVTPTDYDYSTYEETSFADSYAVVYNASFEIAKSVYKVDNDVDFAGSSLIDCAKGIKYFGYANVSTLAEITAQTLLSNTTVQATKDGGAVTDSATLTGIKSQLIQDVATNLMGEYSSLEVRTEKLFVKDIILSDDEMVSGITKENYVYYMFMPKKGVEFKSLALTIAGENLQDFIIWASYNGIDFYLEKDKNDLSNGDVQAYIYKTGNINIPDDAFEDIDTSNLQALSEPKSMLEIVKDSNLNTDLYLQLVDLGVSRFYVLKTSGFTISMQNVSPFIISEFKTVWE